MKPSPADREPAGSGEGEEPSRTDTSAARTPRRIDRASAELRAVRAAGLTAAASRPLPDISSLVNAAGLAGLVRTATDQASLALTGDRILPVLPQLRPLLPGGGLRRGSTIGAIPTEALGASLMLALLAEASAAGAWCAVVGVPTLNGLAAAELGISLDRLALVPSPGAEWATAVAALLDGVDVVVAAPGGPVPASVSSRLAARARQRGSVLVPYGRWPGTDLTIEPVRSLWYGLGSGCGRLCWRELTLRASGRGTAALPREITLWLPGPAPGSQMSGSTGALREPAAALRPGLRRAG